MSKIKLIISGLILVLVVLVGSLYGITKSQEIKDAKLYSESTVATIDDIFTKKGKNIYYFYQEECGHCNEAKPELLKFKEANDKANTDVEFNIIDMGDEKNSDVWYKGDDYTTDKNYKSQPEDIKSLKDLQVAGTPAMLYVEDKKVIDYQIGNQKIYELLNQISSNLGLNVEIGE